MKKILLTTMAAALALSFAVPAQAARHKQTASADVQSSCKAQAAKKFSAIHFIKRRNFVNQCVAEHGGGKVKHARAGKMKHAKAKAKPASNTQAAQPATAQAPKPTTTGQAPKQQ
jgi:hypothetical protein